jgi:uncharacterized protein (DUF1330 family)
MINILVTIKVKNFSLLTEFESIAAKVMHQHGGCIVRAFEIQRDKDGSGEEVHLLEFPNMSAFNNYRSDSLLEQYSDLRLRAIESTHVTISIRQKSYT